LRFSSFFGDIIFSKEFEKKLLRMKKKEFDKYLDEKLDPLLRKIVRKQIEIIYQVFKEGGIDF